MEQQSRTFFILVAFSFFFQVASHGQTVDSLTVSDKYQSTESIVAEADSLRENYLFPESRELYLKALSAISDSLKRIEIEDKVVLSENGAKMSGYVSVPEVVARQRLSLDDFFLYYPLQDKSWRRLPCQIDSSDSHAFAKAVYVEDGSSIIYYSAADSSGARNIYSTHLKDSLWSVPTLLGEHLTSASDEIYPMLSADGKSLYFASSGLYGVGGYDLYVSRKDDDTGEWGIPVNLGFPYSSPKNDFLLAATPDGKYTIFASDRNCQSDSVDVYVLEYDAMPLHKNISDPAEIRRIASLEPAGDPGEDDVLDVFDNMPDNADTQRYVSQMSVVRALRDSISLYCSSLDDQRNRFALSEDDQERENLTVEILRRESVIPVFQDSLDRAVAVLQEIELEFLYNGVVIDPDKINAAADKVAIKADTGYVFTEREFGRPLDLVFEKPEKQFDYSFMVLPQGRFAQDNTLPGGIVYQIQLFNLAVPATVSQLHGLSPVFYRKTSSGRYTYYAGLFRTYSDVLSKLNTVRKAGFRTAYIVAFKDGNPIAVKDARVLEKKISE